MGSRRSPRCTHPYSRLCHTPCVLQESQGYDNGRDLNDDDFEAKKLARGRAILGDGKTQYLQLIEQLIFMEETHMG
jgi:hypothetical protein